MNSINTSKKDKDNHGSMTMPKRQHVKRGVHRNTIIGTQRWNQKCPNSNQETKMTHRHQPGSMWVPKFLTCPQNIMFFFRLGGIRGGIRAYVLCFRILPVKMKFLCAEACDDMCLYHGNTTSTCNSKVKNVVGQYIGLGLIPWFVTLFFFFPERRTSIRCMWILKIKNIHL